MTETASHTPAGAGKKEHSIILRIFAQLFSILFHPIFIPTYVVAFLVSFHPSYFAGFSAGLKLRILLITILNTAFFPAFSVGIMRGLNFIKSVMLPTQQDRIGPYLAVMIFYFWAARVFFKFEPTLDPIMPSFMTGVFLTSIAALLLNIFFKISMHAMGCGGMIGILLVIMNSNSMLMTWPLAAALLITGLVCSSRLIVSDHAGKEIYTGLLAGVVCQLIAAFAVL